VEKDVEFWVKKTTKGNIIEFAVELNQYFSKPKEYLRRGARRRLVKEIVVWVNIFMMEEHDIPFNLITVATT